MNTTNEWNDAPDYAKENDVLQLAEEIVVRMTDEITAGIWLSQFKELTDAEKKMLFTAIADGFNDSTED